MESPIINGIQKGHTRKWKRLSVQGKHRSLHGNLMLLCLNITGRAAQSEAQQVQFDNTRPIHNAI
jgi:hypothetical protein